MRRAQPLEVERQAGGRKGIATGLGLGLRLRGMRRRDLEPRELARRRRDRASRRRPTRISGSPSPARAASDACLSAAGSKDACGRPARPAFRRSGRVRRVAGRRRARPSTSGDGRSDAIHRGRRSSATAPSSPRGRSPCRPRRSSNSTSHCAYRDAGPRRGHARCRRKIVFAAPTSFPAAGSHSCRRMPAKAGCLRPVRPRRRGGPRSC